MSLTSNLNDGKSLVSIFMRSYFPNIPKMVRAANKQTAGAKRILAPEGTPAGTLGDLGTAIDYRIGFNYPEMDLYETIASRASGMVLEPCSDMMFPPPDPRQDPEEIVSSYVLRQFFYKLGEFLTRTRPDQGELNSTDEETLCRYCYTMALMDVVWRSGVIPDGLMWQPKDAQDFINKPPQWIPDDIAAQNALYRRAMSDWLNKPVILNPTFVGSPDVGGADADMIVDGCLIEIKSSRRNIEGIDVRQAVGYCLLDYEDKYGINAVAVYRSRYGVSHRWDINDFLVRAMQWPEQLPILRDKLRQTLREGIKGQQ